MEEEDEQNMVESMTDLETSLEDLGMAFYAQLMDCREGKQCQCDGGGHAQFHGSVGVPCNGPSSWWTQRSGVCTSSGSR